MGSVAFVVAVVGSMPALAQSLSPNVPASDAVNRVSTPERSTSSIARVSVPRRLIDARGLSIGRVLSDTPTTALVEVPFRGGHRKVVVDGVSAFGGPSYSATLYLSPDCSGPGYVSAANFDGTSYVNIWGSGYLLFNLRLQKFFFPRLDAVPVTVTFVSVRFGSSGACTTTSGVVSAFAETELEEFDPLAGFVAPFTIAQR